MDLVKLREALLISSGASDALKNWENVSFLWALKDMQIVARMADKAGLSMPIAGAIKELVKDGRRIKQSNPPDWTGKGGKAEALRWRSVSRRRNSNPSPSSGRVDAANRAAGWGEPSIRLQSPPDSALGFASARATLPQAGGMMWHASEQRSAQKRLQPDLAEEHARAERGVEHLGAAVGP